MPMTNENLNRDLEYLNGNITELNNISEIKEADVSPSSFLKRFFRKMTYWLYKPMFDQQTAVNKHIQASLADIYRIQCGLNRNIEKLSAEIETLRGRDGAFDSLSINVQNNNRDIDALRGAVAALSAPKCWLGKNGRPRVIQLVSSLNYGDAVGNEVIAFKKALVCAGYVTEIFTEAISPKLPADTAKHYRLMPTLDEDDIVIYHFASQCALFDVVKNLKCRVILRYHNITPPEFFEGYDENAVRACSIGLEQAAELKDIVDYCLPVSEFNKTDLENMGYTCPMKVMPILIRFSDYELTPGQGVIDRYSDGITNILFVGRVAPNKKFQDVISAFAEYKKTYDRTARLFLVGSFGEGDRYYSELLQHIRSIGVEDVIFPGHIPFADILAYYSIADVFLCMSEHEGFCVPLVEAMYFHVPVVAYASSAIPSTLGGSGILLESKDFSAAAAEVNRLVTDEALRSETVEKQDRRLRDFDADVIKNSLIEYLEEIING